MSSQAQDLQPSQKGRKPTQQGDAGHLGRLGAWLPLAAKPADRAADHVVVGDLRPTVSALHGQAGFAALPPRGAPRGLARPIRSLHTVRRGLRGGQVGTSMPARQAPACAVALGRVHRHGRLARQGQGHVEHVDDRRRSALELQGVAGVNLLPNRTTAETARAGIPRRSRPALCWTVARLAPPWALRPPASAAALSAQRWRRAQTWEQQLPHTALPAERGSVSCLPPLSWPAALGWPRIAPWACCWPGSGPPAAGAACYEIWWSGSER